MKYILLVICFFCVITSYSQAGYLLKGQVVSVNNEGVANASAIMQSEDDATLRIYALTDEHGLFYFDGLENGQYAIHIYFVGYQSASIDSVVIEGRDKILKPIVLHQKSIELDEVKVFSDKMMFDSQAGKMIYSVDGNLNAVGMSALELMQNIPSLSTDINDRVTLRGSRVTVLIDGIESDLSAMLDRIPSDAIESIEVISNPSAKYESKSGGGVVNVKLKKNANKGYNGKAVVGFGTRNKQNISAQLGYNFSKWKFSSSIDYLKDKTKVDITTNREFITNGLLKYMFQNRNNENLTNSMFFRNSVSYYLDEKSFVGFQYVLQDKSQVNISKYLTDQFDSAHKLLSKSSTGSDGEANNFLNQFSTNFRKIFKEDDQHLFDFNLLYSFNNPVNKYDQLIQPLTIDKGLPQNRYTIDSKDYTDVVRLLKLKADYSQPISAKFKIETGVLFSMNYFSEDFSTIRSNYLRKNSTSEYSLLNVIEKKSNFDFIGYGLSTFGLFSSGFGKYRFNAGLRFEMTVNEAKSDENMVSSFYKLLPSIHLKKISSQKYSWELSYTSRILPPNSKQLNPIVIYQGEYFRNMGNIYLKPEVISQVELANNWIRKKNNYNLTFFVKNRSDIIGKWYYVEKDDEGKDVSFSVDENLGRIFSSGFDANTALTFSKIIFRPSLSTFYNHIDGDKLGPELDRDHVSVLAKFACDYKFTKNLVAILSGKYNSPTISEDGKQFSYYTFDFGFKANFLKQKASFSIKGVDIFNTNEYDRVINQRVNYTTWSHVDPHSFLLYFELSYKFNSVVNKKPDYN